MRLPTQSTLALATLLSALATCGAAPDVASDPPTGTVAAGSTDPPLGALPTTTQPVTVTNTSAVPTTSVPAIADPGDLYALDVASRTDQPVDH